MRLWNSLDRINTFESYSFNPCFSNSSFVPVSSSGLLHQRENRYIRLSQTDDNIAFSSTDTFNIQLPFASVSTSSRPRAYLVALKHQPLTARFATSTHVRRLKRRVTPRDQPWRNDQSHIISYLSPSACMLYCLMIGRKRRRPL